MGYTLLTGATGLLGQYLMRDLTLAGVPLAVVVRPSRTESAVQRIETIMARQERELDRALLRPVILEGNLTESQLGLNKTELEWLKESCDSVVHSAASLTFYAEAPEGEPYLSNVLGTRNVLDVCQAADICQLHYVSTAYICGQRRETILESEVNIGQEPSNDYERTKLEAEEMVRAADHIDQLTVHRPSIIIGDSKTGFTSSYHGFYTPLRLVHALVTSLPWLVILQGDFLGELNLNGSEYKNLVPVDWVSAAMAWLITHSETHGETYHLTNPNPVTTGAMLIAISEALTEVIENRNADPLQETMEDHDIQAMTEDFREQMGVYQSYWQNDPEFDSTNTQQAAPHLPCPEISQEMMVMLSQFAIRTGFGWPRERPAPLGQSVETTFKHYLSRQTNGENLNGHSAHVNLIVSGCGGGQWYFTLNHRGILSANKGIKNEHSTRCQLTSDTFSQVIIGATTFDQAIRAGRILFEGTPAQLNQTERIFFHLAERHNNNQHLN